MLLVLTLLYSASVQAQPAELFEASPSPSVTLREDGPEIARKRYIALDVRKAVQNSELNLNLFADRSFSAQRDQLRDIGETGTLWTGRISDPDGRVVLVVVDDVMAGNIRVGSELYQIRSVGEGIHAIYEVDASMYPEEECLADDPESPAEPPEKISEFEADPCDLIDQMIVYTPAAKASAGGQSAMEALIYLAVAETNMSFDDSNVNATLNPVHITEVTYTESGSLQTDRNRLRAMGDGHMDVVHTLRETYCVDVVSLVTDTGSGCGIAYIQNPAPDPGFEDYAFNVTKDSCATGNFSFGHELGHLLGARHDWYVDDSTSPYSFGHGYVNVANNWRTIMAYNSKCADSSTSCTRLAIWSNPNVLVGAAPAGVSMGTSTSCTEGNLANPSCDAENWQVLNNTVCTVSNFRDRSTCADSNDLWMKDTWKDTGDEPDPLTAGQSMWKSPYIWVRHAQDADRAQQHIHQNPEFGSTNYVYTKLHNDFGTAASGRLKLYWANAATGLAWPGDWTLISDQLVNVDANDTTIAETTWSPPGTGHYCLLARWDVPNNPNDPMTFPEGPSVGDNVRNNNNIVWRNVNVVDLLSDEEADLPSAIVRNTLSEPALVDLLIRQPNTPNNLLRKGGQIFIDLGELFPLWQSTGGRGTGVDPIGDLVQVFDTATATAEILDIPLEPGQEAPVRLRLKAPTILHPGPIPPINDEPENSLFCSSGGQAIPDASPDGVTDSLFVGDCLTIEDLNVSIQTTHSWVGDLTYRLTHLDSGLSVVPYDRPGVPQTDFGCSEDDIDATLDGSAASPVENECATTKPSIQGALIPGDPPNPSMFEIFQGVEICGTWQLQVTDLEQGDTGALGPWCLIAGKGDIIPPLPVTDYEIDLVQLNDLQGEVGGVGYQIHVTPANLGGAVPDGYSRPGTQLRLDLAQGGEILMTWGESCFSTDFAVYEGRLGDFTRHSPRTCSTNGQTFATLPVPDADAYFLVVPISGEFEGSHGLTSDLLERFQGPQPCFPQVIGGCEVDSPAESMPMYEVIKSGLEPEEANELAAFLGIPAGELHVENGAALFVDPLGFQAAPLVPSAVQFPPNEDDVPVVVQAFDFAALDSITPIPGEVAINRTQAALAAAGIVPDNALPEVQHTLLEAVDLQGNELAQGKLDTHVKYAFRLGGVPLLGPGAQIQVSYSPQGTPTSLLHSAYQLQQRHNVRVMPISVAEQRCAELYGPLNASPAPRLVYWAPPLSDSVSHILPHYDCGGRGQVGNESVTLLNRLLPAVVDDGLVPQVQLLIDPAGSTIFAQALVDGGSGPYSYQWVSSSTDLSRIPEDQDFVQYQVLFRSGDTGPVEEQLKVEVTDANGIVGSATQRVMVQPGQPGPQGVAERASYPAVEGSSLDGPDRRLSLAGGPPHGGPAPRVGGVVDFGIERAVSDMCSNNVNRYSSRMDDEAFKRFHWTGSTAWERDFKHAASDGGSDHNAYVDNVDETFYCGHGAGNRFTFESSVDDGALRFGDPVQSPNGDWGDNDLEWLALLSCQVLTQTHSGQEWWQRWGPPFDGLHLLLGFQTNAYDWSNFGKRFAQWQLGRFGITLPVRSAWFQAAAEEQPSGVESVVMGVIGQGGTNNYNDYFHGNGPMGPDIRGSQIIGYWRQVRTTP